METRHYWEENGHAVKYENYNSNDGFPRAAAAGTGCAEQLNFAAAPSEDEDYPAGYMKKGKQDPMSHRIIEKRRRDRMNNCLADLSRLIPPEYLKKGRGRVEKTEIIEMAIRHLKYLQDRVNGLYDSKGKSEYDSERSEGESYRAGYQQAVGEAVRFLAETQGYGDGLCARLAAHLKRHCDHMSKDGRDKPRHAGSSSETASSSSSSHGYAKARAEPPPEPPRYIEYEAAAEAAPYPMECDRVSGDTAHVALLPPVTVSAISLAADEVDAEPLDGRRKPEPTLRAIRKPEHNEDYLHSYKFKNSIERRFSRSQDSEVQDMSCSGSGSGGGGAPAAAHGKPYGHKRRRAAKPAPPTSTSGSGSGSTEDARDTSPQDTSSESPHQHYDHKTSQFVPVFALNALGKYYVPLSVDYACLSRHLGPYDVLDARAAHLAAPLHPVTIHVNFQPCLNYHVKREPNEREWRG